MFRHNSIGFIQKMIETLRLYLTKSLLINEQQESFEVFGDLSTKKFYICKRLQHLQRWQSLNRLQPLQAFEASKIVDGNPRVHLLKLFSLLQNFLSICFSSTLKTLHNCFEKSFPKRFQGDTRQFAIRYNNLSLSSITQNSASNLKIAS